MAMTALERLACEVAITTPRRRSRHCPSAYVAWDLILEIRAEMDKLGINWIAAHKTLANILEQRRAKRDQRTI